MIVVKIVTREGSGKYTVTQQFLSADGATWSDATSPAGVVNKYAYEINGLDGIPVGTRCLAEFVQGQGGKRHLVLQCPFPPPSNNTSNWFLYYAAATHLMTWIGPTTSCPKPTT
jgi:hypothetical protein